jgi:hypothetical protein
LKPEASMVVEKELFPPRANLECDRGTGTMIGERRVRSSGTQDDLVDIFRNRAYIRPA